MARLDFVDQEAVKKLSVGDKIYGNSGMGGSFVYTVEARKNEGLVLSSNSDAPWEKDTLQCWDVLLSKYYQLPSSPLLKASQGQLEALMKAGYDLSPETIDVSLLSQALNCSAREITEGLAESKTVYDVMITGGGIVTMENKHDALAIANIGAGVPPKEREMSMQSFLLSSALHNDPKNPVYKNTTSCILATKCKMAEQGDMLNYNPDERMRDLPTLINHIENAYFRVPEGAKQYVAQAPKGERLFDAFVLSMNTDDVGNFMRTKEILRDPASYIPNRKPQNYESGTEVALFVGAKIKRFQHVPIHNQMFVLYNEELGMTKPEVSDEIKSTVAPLVEHVKNAKNTADALKRELDDEVKQGRSGPLF